MRPLCGKKHGGNRKSQGALARLCEFPGRFRIYRAQRSQQGCSLSLGMLRLAEPPTGRARLRSSLKSPRNPITPFETSRVATLHPELYKSLREDARRVIGATAKPLYAIDGKAVGLDRRIPQTSLIEGGGPPQRWKEFVGGGSHSRSRNGRNGFRIVGSEKNGSNHVYGDFRFATDGQQAVCLLHDVCKLRIAIPLNSAIGFDIAKQAR